MKPSARLSATNAVGMAKAQPSSRMWSCGSRRPHRRRYRSNRRDRWSGRRSRWKLLRSGPHRRASGRQRSERGHGTRVAQHLDLLACRLLEDKAERAIRFAVVGTVFAPDGDLDHRPGRIPERDAAKRARVLEVLARRGFTARHPRATARRIAVYANEVVASSRSGVGAHVRSSN